MLLFVEESNQIINNNISIPINIYPENIPFKKLIPLSYNIGDCNNCNFYKFNDIKNKWEYINSTVKNKILTANINLGGIYCILEDREKPIISNLFPNANSTYKKTDLNKISFNILDKMSNINPNKIQIELDNNKMYFDYISYRELINCYLDNELNPGNHTIRIKAFDNSNNEINISSNFKIIE